MLFQNFLFYKICVFAIIFFCLPLPHGNIYPFLALISGCVIQFKKKHFEINKENIFMISLIFWSFLSVFWAADSFRAFQSFIKVVVLIFSGVLWWNYCSRLELLERQQLQKIVFAAGIVLAILLIFLGFDAQLDLGFRLGFKKKLFCLIDQYISQALVHGCAACMLAIWMNNLRICNSWVYAGLLILLIPIFHFCTSDAASLGLLMGISALIGSRIFPRLLKMMFIYGMPTVWLALPFAFFIFTEKYYVLLAGAMDPSYTHRLFIWKSVSMQAFNRFWTGFGFGSSRYRSLGCEQGIVVFDGTKDLVLSAPENCLHPHNFMLQVWFEFGAVGVMLTCLFWIMYWTKQYDKSTAYTIAFWGSILGVAATGISIWQTWWLILLVVLAPVYRLHDSIHD